MGHRVRTVSSIPRGPIEETVLYTFIGQNGDGAFPSPGSLVIGTQGEIYGTTTAGGIVNGANGNGTVFELIPPTVAGQAWTEAILYRFTGTPGTGVYPGSVVLGNNGHLYGTTRKGGTFYLGTVFELMPPVAHGTWTEKTLHNFAGPPGDGGFPNISLVFGRDGALYGATASGGNIDDDGTVFELAPAVVAGEAWTETVLHNFAGRPTDGGGPAGGVVMGADGTLYVTTQLGGASNGGIVFELMRPAAGGTWSETILHSFSGADGVDPVAGLIIGGSGVLFGTTPNGGSSNGGTVFEGYAIRDPDSTSYVGAIETAGEFGKRLYVEAWKRGRSRAEKKVVMGDGAEWIWNIADQHFPGAVQIVDLYHARQHLWNLARKLYPNQEAEQRRWMMIHQDMLDEGKIADLLAALRSIDTSNPELAEKIRLEAAYFENNAKRMRYPEFRRQHLFVGSGVIEAGCKTVIGSRCKQSGMFWTVRGANAILALRCSQFNGRFEDYWEARRA